MNLSSASFAYPEHDTAVRAELALRVANAVPPADAFVLSTCLRLEVAVPGDTDELDVALESLVGDLLATAKPTVRQDDQAITHLFRVASGLESPVLGESEVLVQFRSALRQAVDERRLNGLFAQVLQSAVAVGRQSRVMLPWSPHNSMASVAVEALGDVDSVAVLGSGIMATAVIKELDTRPNAPEVTIVARNPDKVSSLFDTVVWPFTRATEALSTFPAVISVTSAKQRPIDHDVMVEVLADRTEPLILIDMALPPDFRPETSADLTYLDIDQLAGMASKHQATDEIDEYLERAAVKAWHRFGNHHQVAPVIEGLMRSADDIVDRTVAKFAGRLDSDADEAILRQTAHAVARALLAGPVTYLNRNDLDWAAVDAIADAFDSSDD